MKANEVRRFSNNLDVNINLNDDNTFYKEITLGDKLDLDRMVNSSAPEGTYLFKPSDTSSNLTLCVLDGDRSYKKYRVFVESRGGFNTNCEESQFGSQFNQIIMPIMPNA